MSETSKVDISPSVSIIIAGVIIAVAIIFVGKFPSQAQPADAQPKPKSAKVSAPTNEDHIIGSISAPVVLIEYSDFECPFCQRIHPTLQRIVDESNGQIAWVYRHFPLDSIHANATPAALASECVAEQLDNDGFWKFADAIFASQNNMSASAYATIAAQLGADPAKFASCVASNKYLSRIEAQSAEALSSGASGTPYTIVYTTSKQVPLNGALPYDQIKSVINAL